MICMSLIVEHPKPKAKISAMATSILLETNFKNTDSQEPSRSRRSATCTLGKEIFGSRRKVIGICSGVGRYAPSEF